MSTVDAFGFFANVFGFIVSVVSLAAILVNVFLYHLPSNQIKELESLIDKTDKIFKEAMEDGLLTEPALVQQAEDRLTMLKVNTFELHHRVYKPSQDFLELLRGTSASIRDVCQSAKELRAQLMTLSQEGRKRLMKEDAHEVPLALPPPARLHNPSLEHRPCSFPSPQISTPSSFSIKTRVRGLSRVRRARKGLVKTGLWRTLSSVYTDPSCDRARSGSDVREANTQISVLTCHTSVTAEDGA